MMTQPVASISSTSTPQKEAPPTNPTGVLNQNDFLKLMIAQLQAQNPLQPGNSNEFLNELAQFTQVEQITNLAGSSELTGAVQLIGHEVTYKGADGAPATGTVESIQTSSSGTTLTISGTPGINQLSITEVH